MSSKLKVLKCHSFNTLTTHESKLDFFLPQVADMILKWFLLEWAVMPTQSVRTSWITLSFSPRNVMLSKSSHGVACGGRQWVTIFHASNVFIARQLYRRIVTSRRDDISAERPKNWTKMGANSCPVSTPWFLFNRPLWGNEIHHRWNRSTEESNLSVVKIARRKCGSWLSSLATGQPIPMFQLFC